MFKYKLMTLLLPALCGLVSVEAIAAQGPSSSESPYLIPAAGVSVTSLLTVGDSIKSRFKEHSGYRMAGIPDGLGAYDNGDGSFTLLMSHEIKAADGVTRKHGYTGAFISSWIIRKQDLKVIDGEDLISKVQLWDSTLGTYADGSTAFDRLCSADLAPPTAFYNRKTGKGYSAGRIFLNGEESASSRAFAHLASGAYTGTSFEFAAMGRASWENLLANPYEQDRTLVIGTDDKAGGNVYLYIGKKQRQGNAMEKAGLTGGKRYSIGVVGHPVEDRDTGIAAGTRFQLTQPGSGTAFLRPEDGAWDPVAAHRFYFTTTDRYDQVKDGVGSQTGRSRLWRLSFEDISHPERGGTIEMMLDGSEAGNMYDNLTISPDGMIFLQEDVGKQAHNGKIWMFNPNSRVLTLIAQHDPVRFGDLGQAAAEGFNQDEESSGIIDISHILAGVRGYDTQKYRYLLATVQAHVNIKATEPELVEKGQLVMLTVAK